MSERGEQIEAFLTDVGWQEATRQPLAGDLSSRRYTRLVLGSEQRILMDAQTSMVPFADMTHWLRRCGLSAPEIYAARATEGLLLLEDFGSVSVNARLAAAPEVIDEVDDLCVALLLALRGAAPPELVEPDADTLVDMTRLADGHYPGVDGQRLEAFRTVLLRVFRGLRTQASVSLRDFHADNLMWLGDRHGIQRLGLLDYQDAFLTHPVYDLVSYLTDARTDILGDRRERVLARYLAASGDEEEAFRVAFAAFAAQRNLRILGIFARSAQEGKTHHVDKLARVHGYLVDALGHPVFDDVRQATLAALPDPAVAAEALA